MVFPEIVFKITHFLIFKKQTRKGSVPRGKTVTICLNSRYGKEGFSPKFCLKSHFVLFQTEKNTKICVPAGIHPSQICHSGKGFFLEILSTISPFVGLLEKK